MSFKFESLTKKRGNHSLDSLCYVQCNFQTEINFLRDLVHNGQAW